MRIAARTSGGRGEWELAGTQGVIGLSEVADKELILELVPGLRVSTETALFSEVWEDQGKPRLRRIGNIPHTYQLLTAALLLPRPIRDPDASGSGRLTLADGSFSVEAINFDIVSLEADKVVFTPSTLVLTNADRDYVACDHVQRMRLVLDLWRLAHENPHIPISALLTAHHDACHASDAVAILSAGRAILNTIGGDGDPLVYYLQELDATSHYSTGGAVHREGLEEALADDDPRTPFEASRERVRKLRLQAVRGPAGRRFRLDVRAAYDSTCLFTGYYLPKTELTSSSGVDAAHILPWADYDLNVPTNGICLSKLCHWGFDEGIIRLEYDPTAGYILSIPDGIRELRRDGAIDLTPFEAMAGPIPPQRLPSDHTLWPDPAYLTSFNEAFPF